MASAAQQNRRLWVTVAAGFAMSVVGAIVLLNPTLEFLALDIIEKIGLPVGPVGNLALYFECALFAVSMLGLVVLTIHHLATKRPKPDAE